MVRRILVFLLLMSSLGLAQAPNTNTVQSKSTAFQPFYFPPAPAQNGLWINVNTGSFWVSGNPTTLASARLPLAANTTSYVYLDLTAKQIKVGTTGFPGSVYPIATAATNAFEIFDLEDVRPDVFGGGSGGGGNPFDPTANIAFTGTNTHGGSETFNATGVFTSGITAAPTVGLPDATSGSPSYTFTNHPEMGFYVTPSPVTLAITQGSRTGCPSSCLATLTLTSFGPSGAISYYAAGQTVFVSGAADPTFNGLATLSSTNQGALQISYSQTGPATNPGSIGAGGTVQIYVLGAAAHDMLFNRLQSSSANPAQTGSLELGPVDPIKYRCVSGCAGGVSPVDFILAQGNGSMGSAQIGDTPGIRLTGPLGFTIFTNSANGTTANKLVIFDTAHPGQLRTALASSTNGIIGVCQQTCTTSGTPDIGNTGPLTIALDGVGANTVGDYVIPSSTVAGSGTDGGSSISGISSQIVGVIQASLGGGLYTVYVSMGFSQGGGAGGGAVLLAAGAVQTVQPSVASAVPLIRQCPIGAAGTLNCDQVNNAAGTALLGVQQNGTVVFGSGAGGTVSGVGSLNSIVYAQPVGGLLTQDSVNNALASNTTVIVPPGTYNISTANGIILRGGFSNVTMQCIAGTVFNSVAGNTTTMLFIDDNSGGSAGNSHIKITGPCKWVGNGIVARIIDIQSSVNASSDIRIDGGWTAGGTSNSHVIDVATLRGGGSKIYLTRDIHISDGTITSVPAGAGGVRFFLTEHDTVDHITCIPGSLADGAACISGNGVDDLDAGFVTAYDYFSASSKGDGYFCVFCSHIHFHDGHFKSQYINTSSQCGSQSTCAVGWYLDTAFDSSAYDNVVEGGTMCGRAEVNFGFISHDNHCYNNSIVAEKLNTRTGSTSADGTMVNSLVATTGLVAGANWTLGLKGSAPSTNCRNIQAASTDAVTITATGTPSGAIVSQDLGSVSANWINTPLLEICIDTSATIPPGVLQLVLDASASPFSGHTAIPLPAGGLKAGGTTVQVWDIYSPIKWGSSPGGVRSWGLNATAAVPSGVVITISQFARLNPGNNYDSHDNVFVNAGTHAMQVGGPIDGLEIHHNQIINTDQNGNTSVCGIVLDNTTTFNPGGGNGLGFRSMVNGHVTENEFDQSPLQVGGGSGSGLIDGICGSVPASNGPIDKIRVYKNFFPNGGFTHTFDPGFGAGVMTNYQEQPTFIDAPGAITVNAGTCTDRNVTITNLIDSSVTGVLMPTAGYALEANIMISPGQAAAGAGHYRICNVQSVGNITLNAGSTFTLAVIQGLPN